MVLYTLVRGYILILCMSGTGGGVWWGGGGVVEGGGVEVRFKIIYYFINYLLNLLVKLSQICLGPPPPNRKTRLSLGHPGQIFWIRESYASEVMHHT